MCGSRLPFSAGAPTTIVIWASSARGRSESNLESSERREFDRAMAGSYPARDNAGKTSNRTPRSAAMAPEFRMACISRRQVWPSADFLTRSCRLPSPFSRTS